MALNNELKLGIFIQENSFKYYICKIVAILAWLQMCKNILGKDSCHLFTHIFTRFL